jgi:hypothetical protein
VVIRRSVVLASYTGPAYVTRLYLPVTAITNAVPIRTDDYGATWASTSAFTLNSGLATSIVVPYQNTAFTTIFYGDGAATARRIRRSVGGFALDISPTSGGNIYGVGLASNQGNRAIAVCDSDANTLVLMGYNQSTGNYGVFRTRNAITGTPIWETLIAPGAIAYRSAYTGDRNLAYLIGTNGAIALVDGSTVYNKKGNNTSAGTIVGIAGG